MNFIDDFIYKVKTGRLFAGLEKPKEATPVLQGELSAEPAVEKKIIGPEQVIHFLFMGKTYIAEGFNLNFKADVDPRKNRPNSFTYGGTMQITLSEAPDHNINDWMAQTDRLRSGEIRFFRNMPKITDSAQLTVFFEDAYCVSYSKKMDTKTPYLLTTLTISPRKVKIGKEEFENRWKKKESLSNTITSV
jgi:hypothetical protein